MVKKFNIHDWQAKQRLVEFDVHPFSRQYDGPGEEGKMAKADIIEVIDDAQDIAKMIDPDTNLPEWVEAKITKAADYLNKVKDYLSNYDVSRNLNESLNPEVSQKVNSFIKAMAKRYDYSEQDAVFAIMAALKQRKTDEASTTGTGASFTPGTGAAYATPKAFGNNKNKKRKGYMGYKEI